MRFVALVRLALLLVGALAGCGYQPVGRSWPAQLGRIRVLLPEGASLAEPELLRMLELELVRQLARAGARATSSEPSSARLHCRALRLDTTDSALDPGGRRIAARALRLRLMLRLARTADDQTLWASGLVEVEQLWSLAAGAEISEASRRATLQRLAARAAEQAVELLEAVGAPRSPLR